MLNVQLPPNKDGNDNHADSKRNAGDSAERDARFEFGYSDKDAVEADRVEDARKRIEPSMVVAGVHHVFQQGERSDDDCQPNGSKHGEDRMPAP